MISAVIPTDNRGHLVERAVLSVLGQSVQPVEIIVVDDGSQDDTRERISGLDERVKYIYQNNAGSAAARNTGLMAAKMEWVALLDSDDVWHERPVERMKSAILATKGSANYYFAETLEPIEKGSGLLWENLQFDFENRLTLTYNRTAMGTKMRAILLADLLDGSTPMSSETRVLLKQRWVLLIVLWLYMLGRIWIILTVQKN